MHIGTDIMKMVKLEKVEYLQSTLNGSASYLTAKLSEYL